MKEKKFRQNQLNKITFFAFDFQVQKVKTANKMQFLQENTDL